MDISWVKYKQILLNDRQIYYRPNRELAKRLATVFPDINIFGFGKYPQTGCWYILAQSDKFPANLLGSPATVSMSEVYNWSKPKLI